MIDFIRYTFVQNLLPSDLCRPYLMTTVGRGYDNYINAVFVNGHKTKRGFISTQLPLPNTVVDFWCLLYDHKVSVDQRVCICVR